MNNIRIDTKKTEHIVYTLLKLLNVETPKHYNQTNPKKDGSEFDLNTVFSILTSLSMEQGWTANYDYCIDFGAGYPVTYAQGPSGEKGHFLDHVIADGSDDGHFQLGLLTIMHDMFYLTYYAIYKQYMPVVSEAGMLKLMESIKIEFLVKDINPSIEYLLNGTIAVNICVFNGWIGVIKKRILMNKFFPYNLAFDEDTVLVSYDCGIRF